MKKIAVLLLSCLIIGCSANSDPCYWRSEHVASASRLLYDNPENHLKVEFLNLEDGLGAFVYTDQNRFGSAEIVVRIDGEEQREELALRRGQMRARLGAELTEQLINALINQKEVAIFIGGFQERLNPHAFESAYGQFSKGASWLMQSIKGPLE